LLDRKTPESIIKVPIRRVVEITSSRKMMPSEMLDSGTKYVTYEAFIGPIRLIRPIKMTKAAAVLTMPKVNR